MRQRVFIILSLLITLLAGFALGWIGKTLVVAPQLISSEIITSSKQLRPPGKLEEEALQSFSNGLLAQFSNMSPVKVLIRGSDEFKWSSSDEIGVFLPIDNGDNSWNEPVIILQRDLVQYSQFSKILRILKHEMTHAWL